MNHESRKFSPPLGGGEADGNLLDSGIGAGESSSALERGDSLRRRFAAPESKLSVRRRRTEREDSPCRGRSGNPPAARSASAAILAAAILSLTPTSSLAAEKTAIFAGGCFWCVESDFEKVPGVIEAVSGYTGGELENPTYRNHGRHIEAVRIMYDDEKVDYATLLDIFWRSVDPLDSGGQFCDRGHSYTTAIFALDGEQLRIAKASKAAVDASGKLPSKIATPIREAGAFTDAEDYHQDYYKKNPIRYRFYRFNCGRDARIKELWGDEAHAGIDHG